MDKAQDGRTGRRHLSGLAYDSEWDPERNGFVLVNIRRVKDGGQRECTEEQSAWAAPRINAANARPEASPMTSRRWIAEHPEWGME